MGPGHEFGFTFVIIIPKHAIDANRTVNGLTFA